uniref:8.9 kDa family member n=1 Tax=Rhipicephalus appendiculatus TaxID=34631 RepID=A0A131Z4S0_RHIAP
MNMNALSIVMVILTAQNIFEITTGKRIWPLTIVRNYTCQYGPYGIPDHVCLDVSHPCVSLCCSAGGSQLVINGCPLPADFNNTTLDGWGYWPNCCTRTRLRRPRFPPAALYYARDGSWRYRYVKTSDE